MVTWHEDGGKIVFERLSTDDKPTTFTTISGKETGIPNGSTLYTMDNAEVKVEMWDAENERWLAQ